MAAAAAAGGGAGGKPVAAAAAATAATGGKATKKALAKYEAGIEKVRRARQKAAAWAGDASAEVPRDLLAELPAAFRRYAAKGDGGEVTVEGSALGAGSWTPALEAFAFDTTKANMRPIYAEAPGWEWNDVKKRGELFDSETRYLFVRAAADAALVALLAFRFVLEGDYDALYVYELQVAAGAQHRGIGKYLMMLAEALARKAGMQKCVGGGRRVGQWRHPTHTPHNTHHTHNCRCRVMLTVLKNNAAAVSFYTKLKYEEEEDVDDEAPYHIMSKVVDKAGVAAIEARRNILATGMLPADA